MLLAALLRVDGATAHVRMIVDDPNHPGKPIDYAFSDERLRVDAESYDFALLTVGLRSAVRMSILSTTGEDYLELKEFTILLRFSSPVAPQVLWVGDGNHLQRMMDSCFLNREAAFEEKSDGSLVRTFTTQASFANADIDDKLVEDIRKKCVAEPKQVAQLPLTPKPLSLFVSPAVHKP
jgi:hypothetical protein